MFDVYYFGKSPNLFPHEKPADSIVDAATQSRTTFFWYLDGQNDYSKFNFDFKPLPWENSFIHVWANQWQTDGGVYFVNKNQVDSPYLYHSDNQVHRLPNSEWWSIPNNIDNNSIDLRWAPDPLDPPYEYHFPSQHQSSSGVIYTCPNAIGIKLVDAFVVTSVKDTSNWHIPTNVSSKSIDFTWHPNPLDTPTTYHFPSQHQSSSGVTYTCPNAIGIKLVDAFVVTSVKDTSNWHIPTNVSSKSIDFTWHPNPLDTPYEYHFPSQHQSSSGVTYTCPNAIGIKLIDAFVVNALQTTDNWHIPTNIDMVTVDFTWHPNPLDTPYEYHFPSQHQSSSGVIYTCPNAIGIKLIDAFMVTSVEDTSNWHIPTNVSSKSIDFTWHPNPLDTPYEYHFPSQHQSSSGVTYTCPNAIGIKLVDAFVVTSVEDTSNWHIPDNIDQGTIDFRWHPNPMDTPTTYHFPSQHQSSSGVTYTCDGAIGIKLIDAFVVNALQTTDNWFVPSGIDSRSIDFTWHPNPLDTPTTYHFPSQHQSSSGVIYTCPNAIGIKLIDAFVVRTISDLKNWTIPNYIDVNSIDFSWRPNPLDPPYEYHFPSQHQSSSGVIYTCNDSEGVKLIDAFVVKALPTTENWYIPDNINVAGIDFTWHPNALDTPTTYHFPVQWDWDNIGGPEYRVPGAIGDEFISNFVATTKSNMENWAIPDNIDRKSFDFSWVPHPADPPFIYKFPTAWNNEGGPEYHVPNAVEVKYINVQVASTVCDTSCWTIPEEINIDTVDFTWVPHPKSPPYIYHFGTEHQSSVGLTYTVLGANELKFAGDIPTKDTSKKALEVLDIFFIDFNNSTAKIKFDKLLERYPATKIRYANSIIDTIKRCTTRSQTSKFWVISSECDYSEFDFSWHAEPWQSYMTHVFASQHQKWSNTFLINKWEFERNITWAKSLEEFPNLNFVSGQAITMPSDLYDIYLVDHGNEHSPSLDYIANLKTTRYVDNYLDTFKRIMSTATTEYVWIISSLCEYNKFDFSWYPEPWQKEMIHVFPSGNQARGDTFFIHVESFKQQMVELDILDWFNVINYCTEQTVSRLPVPNCIYKDDTLIDTIKNHDFKHPYTYFAPHNYPITIDFCVWGAKDKKIHSFSDGNAYVLIPREAKTAIKTQGYDYPYISKLSSYFDEPKLDIIYISNGESHEEEMSDHLVKVAGEIQWVRNVPSRDAAIRRAAEQSSTPWFFAVPAKLEVDSKFDWYWQPDYLQESKHYIFHAKNPVNGLQYGHMAMVAYNRKLVLDTTEYGLDFTLSKAHTVIPLLSGIAHYNVDKLMTWRTAFREVLKLKYDVDQTGSIDSTHRLKVWLTVALGENSEWSLKGASDAIEYYTAVNGDYDKLMHSFTWAWLENYFNTLYMSST